MDYDVVIKVRVNAPTFGGIEQAIRNKLTTFYGVSIPDVVLSIVPVRPPTNPPGRS